MLQIHADMEWSAIQAGAECGSSDETKEKSKLKIVKGKEYTFHPLVLISKLVLSTKGREKIMGK